MGGKFGKYYGGWGNDEDPSDEDEIVDVSFPESVKGDMKGGEKGDERHELTSSSPTENPKPLWEGSWLMDYVNCPR